MLQSLTIAAAFAASLFITTRAQATETFPPTIADALKLSYTPPCSLCHAGGKTGSGTVTTLFGVAMRGRGLKPNDEASLRSALASLEKDSVDSDGDKVTDIAELKARTDPNSLGGAALDVPAQVYGCGAATIASSASTTSWGGWALAFGVVLCRKRRRTSAKLAVGGAALWGVFQLGCYDVSYVSSDKCASGATWTGGDSEEMKPGQTCISCHARDHGPRFTFAGSVMKKRTEHDDCIGEGGVKVTIIGADGRAVEMTSNDTGNFRTNLSVGLPYTARVTRNGKTLTMTTAQTEGDCNSCHTEKGHNGAPGRITSP